MGWIEDLIKQKQVQQSDAIHETVAPIIYNVRTQEKVEKLAKEGTERLKKLREQGKQAVIKPDYRTSDQRAVDDKEANYKHQQYQEQKDDQKRAEGWENLIKLTSPSTYVEAATGWQLTPVGKLATDVLAFGIAGGAKNLLTRGFGDQFTTLSARFGYYGSNPITRAYGTFARRFNLPDKYRLPELMRKHNGEVSPSVDWGVGKRTEGHVNFTWDRPVVAHPQYRSLDQMNLYIINPQKVLTDQNLQYLRSIEPSDLFTEGLPKLQLSPKDVTLVSGDELSLQTARKQGMPTLSSEKARQLYKEASQQKGLLEKPDWYAYSQELQRLQSLRGTPTLKDAKALEQYTGLNAGVADVSLSIPFKERAEAIMRNPFKNYELPKYPNGREFDPSKHNKMPSTLNSPYNKLFYDPASDIEQQLGLTIGTSRQFSTNPVTRATTIHTTGGNPLETRLARLKEHTQYGFTPETNQGLMITPRLRANNVRDFAKQIDSTLTEDQLDQIVQIAYANKRGVHIPIGNSAGETTGGLSIVDIQDAINYLKQSGVEQVTPYDVGIIAGHEAGHGVQVSPAAKKAIQDFPEPEEFYTRAGQILDSAGVTSTADNPLSYGQFMQLTDDYLKQGNLDNGITILKNYMTNLSPLKRQQVMAGINRFSVGLGSAYLLNNKR